MPAKRIVTPDMDTFNYVTFEYAGEAYSVKKKFKIGRFLKVINENPMDAIEIALTEESYEKFLDLEITMDELKEFMESVASAISGSGLKN